MQIIIYEDEVEDFLPLVQVRPQHTLRVGAFTMHENCERLFPRVRISFIGRDLFHHRAADPVGPTLYVSARAFLEERIVLANEDTRYVVDGVDAAFLKASPPMPRDLEGIRTARQSIRKQRSVKGWLLAAPWDLIRLNETLLRVHAGRFRSTHRVGCGVTVLGRRGDVKILGGAVIEPPVVLDVRSGPIVIDRRAVIRPFSHVVGPCYIGSGSVLERTHVTGSSFGPECRIGGEVEASIFQGFANKHHEGFIGHSYIGEWVNLGALTTNSDLKNNYGPVRLIRDGRECDTGMTKLGAFIGDHVKLGIGTLIPTGAVIGAFVNIFGGGMIPRNVASFRWIGPGVNEPYDVTRALATAAAVMERRGVPLTREFETVVRVASGAR